MKKLFLTSTGLPLETRQYFLDLIGKPPQEMKVAFIPTAADLDEDKWYVDAAKNQLKEIGFPFFEVDLKENPKVVKEKLENCDVIYVNGGNTFYLLDWVRKSRLDKYLDQLIENGKIYLGGSAGSVIVGPNIELAGWKGGDENTVNLQDLTGLNIVPFAISPHFTEDERTALEEKSKTVSYQIIPITNEQAVIVTDSEYKIIGKIISS